MATVQDRNAPQQSVYPRSHVGFDSITSQIERKLLKRGFQFNVICVGKCALSSREVLEAVKLCIR
jgi:septin 3/9/12